MNRSQPQTPDTTPASGLRGRPLDRVLETVRFLRRRCPWDAAQTPRSLLPYLLEEAHEVAEAVEDDDDAGLVSELGDLMLHLAFQIVLAEERGAFDAERVADAVVEKMRRRHPHLYGAGTSAPAAGTAADETAAGEFAAGDVEASSSAAWEARKARERPGRSLVDGLARGLDPLSRAHRMQERVSAVGFDWDSPAGALEKVREEVDEVAAALASGQEAATEEELGDLLFAVVNLTRLSGSHGMHALGRANRKFGDRFRALERLAAERGLDLAGADLETLDGLWDEVKAAEPGGDREA